MRKNKFRKSSNYKAKRFTKRTVTLALIVCSVMVSTFTTQAAKLADVFDTKQYADDYEDLKAAFGYDDEALLNHYLTYGISERREVAGLIDVVKYRETYPDLDAAFGDNWDAYVDHYLTYGIYEGRDSGTDFDASAYAERYQDLKETYGDDVLGLYLHYLTYGKGEGRIASNEADFKTLVGDDKSDLKIIEATVPKLDEKPDEDNRTENIDKDDEPKNNDKGNQTGSTTHYPNGTVKEVREFDEKGNTTKWEIYHEDGSLTYLELNSYEYDSLGRLIKSKCHIWSDEEEYRDFDGNYYSWSWVIVYEYENDEATEWFNSTSTEYKGNIFE